jgi:hypothetical protein
MSAKQPEPLTINYHGKKIRLTENMLGYLQHALKLPNRWHEIGQDIEGKDAVKRLEKAGLVEIRDYSNHYKVRPNG